MKSANLAVEDFDELLSYLPVLYGNGFKPIRRWGGGNKTDKGVFLMPWPEYEEVVESFFSIAARACWSDPEYVSKDIGDMIRDPQRVARATLQEIKSMLTWCVRGERFCDGHWASVIEDGSIRNVLLRLQALRPQ
jgi:hypothetical protein